MKETDFVQLSTRLRASLGSLSHSERVQKAIDSATSPSSLASAFRSIMMQDASSPESAGLDEMCDAYLAYTVETVKNNSPVRGLYDSLLLKYDAANLKLAVKAVLRSSDDPAMFPFGTLDPNTVLRAAKDGDFSALPAGLREGCEKAVASYNASADAMSVDLEIDRGCFADMTEAAKRSGIPLLVELCSIDADTANVTAFARIAELSLAPEAKRELFSRAFVCGGRIGEEKFPRAEVSFEALEDALGGSYLGEAIHSASDSSDRVASLEAALRKKRSSLCDAIKFVPFGGEVPAAFIVEREAEVRAFSLAAAYMRRGATQADIRTALGR
jgi:V/A-type H+-transporting ATPase subunit C